MGDVYRILSVGDRIEPGDEMWLGLVGVRAWVPLRAGGPVGCVRDSDPPIRRRVEASQPDHAECERARSELAEKVVDLRRRLADARRRADRLEWWHMVIIDCICSVGIDPSRHYCGAPDDAAPA